MREALGAVLIAGLIAAALALALFSWLGVGVLAGEIYPLDEHLRTTLHGMASPALTRLMWATSAVTAPKYLVPAGLLLALAFLLRGWPRGALLIIVTMVGAGVLDLWLKATFGRIRPAPFFGYPLPKSAGFPSGHALFAVCFFGGLAALLSARLRTHGARAAVWAVAVMLIVLVGISRVYLGVHYPSDVVAGYAAGFVWVTAVAAGDRLMAHWRRRRASSISP